MTIDKPTTLDAPGRREVTEPTTAAGRQPTKPLGSGLDALWEALAADIHAHGYSVRDALAAHRLAIEAEARATATDLDALNAYLDTIDPEKAEARAQVEALTIDHHKAAAVFDRMVRAEAQVAELRRALVRIEGWSKPIGSPGMDGSYGGQLGGRGTIGLIFREAREAILAATKDTE